MEGIIFNIQRFCVQDGPGIRTTVFLKGCPLRCAWCHNPESHRRRPEVLFDAEKCLRCGACAAVCHRHVLKNGAHEFFREDCAACGRCAEVCYADALEMCGRAASVDEVLDVVVRDRAFYRENGGMTLSGGEPMSQPEFALALAEGTKARGLHVCMETCGECAPEALRAAAKFVDLFLYDVKLLDDAAHRQYTGVSNRRILENLTMLDRMGKPVVLRCPILPGVNLNDAHFEGVAALAQRLSCVQEIQFEPYHPLGVQKSARLGRESAYANREFLDRVEVEAYVRRAQEKTRVKMVVQ